MIRIGLSGWSYRHWREVFYPPGLSQTEQLAYAASRFPTLEINRTFYSLGKPAWFEKLREVAPPDFIFAVKGGRFITHMKKLIGVNQALANFFGSGVLELAEKLGPILWQFPSAKGPQPDAVIDFMKELPRSLEAAALCAAESDRPDRSWPRGLKGPLRHAFEIRDESLIVPSVIAAMRRHNVALVGSHSERWPWLDIDTSDFRYLRLHGPRELYTSAYSPSELKEWAHMIKGWKSDVFVYFDNDGHGHAPRQAIELAQLLSA